MKLTETEARARLAADDHGTLCTVHAERGVDAVPCVYTVDDDGFVGIPIDRVKPKSSPRLKRQSNVELDPRAALLIKQWDHDDWSRLWWVRAQLLWDGAPPAARESSLAARLARAYEQYRKHEDQPFERVLVFRVVAVTGWAAAPDA